jgi:hypothetical protein
VLRAICQQVVLRFCSRWLGDLCSLFQETGPVAGASFPANYFEMISNLWEGCKNNEELQDPCRWIYRVFCDSVCGCEVPLLLSPLSTQLGWNMHPRTQCVCALSGVQTDASTSSPALAYW